MKFKLEIELKSKSLKLEISNILVIDELEISHSISYTSKMFRVPPNRDEHLIGSV